MEENLFLSYISYTFRRWNGLQAAVNEGMGGPYGKEKVAWMATEIENYFNRYDVVAPDDIEEYLGAMIENEFDTYFEDNSLKEVSKNICTAYKLSKENPQSEIFKGIFERIEPISVKPTQEVESEEEEDPCKPMAELNVNDPEEDGWTTVQKKNKKVK